MTRNRRFHRNNRFRGSRRFHLPWVWVNILTIILVPIVMSYVFEYIPYTTSVMKAFSASIFIVMLFFVSRATYFLLRKINRINLMSDLALWLLQIFSGLMIFVTSYVLIITLFFGMFTKTKNPYALYSLVLFIVIVFLISAFGAFRGGRRQKILGIWH